MNISEVQGRSGCVTLKSVHPNVLKRRLTGLMVCHALSWCERASISLGGIEEHKELSLTELCVRTYTVVALSSCILCLQMLQQRTVQEQKQEHVILHRLQRHCPNIRH